MGQSTESGRQSMAPIQGSRGQIQFGVACSRRLGPYFMLQGLSRREAGEYLGLARLEPSV